MENSGSSSRKRSSNHIRFFPQEQKRGRIEYQDHEEPNLDLSLQLGSSRTVQNQRAQIQAPPAAEDKIAKWEAVRAELERAEDENRLLKEKLSEANMENKALQDRHSELLLEHNPDEQGGAVVSPSSSDRTLSDHDRSSPSNPDRTQPIMKDTQVSLRIRPEQKLFHDGCHWRKYGEKLSKGNPFPRAYFRCSCSLNVKRCSVHKKVQRCAEDPTAWTITYKGSHNHQLPPAALATANATSAAMSMLMSGSLSSASVISDNSVLAGATISVADPFPTVMVDYTRPPPAFARMSELTEVIFTDPRVKAALASAITASFSVPKGKGDGDSQENGKKE
ncbi:WRKY transcription factor 6-like [Zingiber officinale]|uniref:WRKY domain-containing protein n=1 Tax=Zingiber officinale TaxID=94328 RepID=A0A8J5CVI3_ZINOF|nr:WRKY transcription factor 6-like [Zingiber officinale]KAG6471491.1 hypothetical protein ZIOFF_068933 [Zingiber officinale]